MPHWWKRFSNYLVGISHVPAGVSCLSLCTTEESGSICPSGEHPPEAFPSPCWTNTALSLSSCISCSNSLAISVASSGLIPVCWCTVESKSGHSAPDAVSYPSAYCLRLSSYSSACSQLPLLQGHTAVSSPTCGPPGLPPPLLPNCCLSTWPLPVLLHEVVPSQVQDSVFAFVEFHEVFLSQLPQLKLPLYSGSSPSSVSIIPSMLDCSL